MSTTTLNSIAIDVVGQYSQAAHHWVEALRAGAERVVSGAPAKAVVRASELADGAIDSASGRAIEGMEAFGKSTEWASDMLVVNALRTINLPVAKLSLTVASRVNDTAARLAQRAAGATVEEATPVKRTRRAAAKA